MTEGAKVHQERLNRLTIEEKKYLLEHAYRINKIIENVAMQGESNLVFFFTSARADCEDAFKLLFDAARISTYSFESDSGSDERYANMTISFGKPEDCVFVLRVLEGNIYHSIKKWVVFPLDGLIFIPFYDNAR
ncbi:hypothetical protein IKH83_02745 [Candidatus Saccharibacteria bacterium]|nr:hypothetical protein [Candidatus Saccharibacteria bacterium]